MKKILYVVLGSLISILLLIGIYLGIIHLTGNIHTVIPSQVYRAQHLSVNHLQRVIKEYQIKTVLDLAPISDLAAEEKLAQIDHITYIYLPLKSMQVTPPVQLKKLTQILIHAKKPILIHCKSGSDRTGLASAVALVLHNADINTAMQQVEYIRYGITNKHSTGRVTLQPYKQWLQQQRLPSTRGQYLLWLRRSIGLAE